MIVRLNTLLLVFAFFFSFIMINGINYVQSDFVNYLNILENNSFENIRDTEPFSKIIFYFMSLFENTKIVLTIFSIFE